MVRATEGRHGASLRGRDRGLAPSGPASGGVESRQGVPGGRALTATASRFHLIPVAPPDGTPWRKAATARPPAPAGG
jgi:hypothetical protein